MTAVLAVLAVPAVKAAAMPRLLPFASILRQDHAVNRCIGGSFSGFAKCTWSPTQVIRDSFIVLLKTLGCVRWSIATVGHDEFIPRRWIDGDQNNAR